MSQKMQKENIIIALFKAFRKKISMSLSLRIASNFLKLMSISGILFFLLFQVLYMMSAISMYSDYAEAEVVRMEGSGFSMDGEINSLKTYGIRLRLVDSETHKVIYSDSEYVPGKFLGLFNSLHIDFSDKENAIVYEDSMDVFIGNRQYTAIFCYNLTADFSRMLRLTVNLVFVYFLIVLFGMKQSRDEGEKMLEPIGDMTATISSLTINNLSSERIDVQETNTELQDLAQVFNEMLDRLEASYESQKQFVSNASHELRTPIAVIQGYANMLKRWGSRDEAVLFESVDAIQNESREMQDLVNKLLFLSRHDKKTLRLERTCFNMCEIVEDLAKETQMVVTGRHIEIPALEAVDVYGDKQSLKQLVRIFVDNAIKYSEENDTVKISCRNAKGDCVIVVEDTGLGMTLNDVNNIFERFYRSDEVRGKKISGHGLGLSIARLIVAAHGGTIKIRTQYTKGTKFTIVIPGRKEGY